MLGSLWLPAGCGGLERLVLESHQLLEPGALLLELGRVADPDRVALLGGAEFLVEDRRLVVTEGQLLELGIVLRGTHEGHPEEVPDAVRTDTLLADGLLSEAVLGLEEPQLHLTGQHLGGLDASAEDDVGLLHPTLPVGGDGVTVDDLLVDELERAGVDVLQDGRLDLPDGEDRLDLLPDDPITTLPVVDRGGAGGIGEGGFSGDHRFLQVVPPAGWDAAGSSGVVVSFVP